MPAPLTLTDDDLPAFAAALANFGLGDDWLRAVLWGNAAALFGA